MRGQEAPIPNLSWIGEVGAKKIPHSGKIYNVTDYGAKGDAMELCTETIQKTIDTCAANGGGTVTFNPGIYLTGSVFVKDNVIFNIPKGVMLIGSQKITDYKRIDTRIAGIEMNWPSALINVIGQSNVEITGDGVINGRGKVFWDKYRIMSKEYNSKGLRWIVDYDCERPRGILISNSSNVTVKGIVLYQPGFWSLHVLYSECITIDSVIISNNIEGRGPSTDGIDIDSSRKVLVQNCNVNCNDDNFCLKAGRDSDGLRVNKPCEYVVIRDCIAGHGDGLFTCGSETSGGIRHVLVYNMRGVGTQYGLRFKSTIQRGGVIEDIYLQNIEMDGVSDPFVVDLNWLPAYNASKLPVGYDVSRVPIHWRKMLTPVSSEQGTPKFRNIYFENITAINATTCIKVGGVKTGTIDNFTFKNTAFEGINPGYIKWAKDWKFEDFSVKASNKGKVIINDCSNIKINN